MTQTILENAAWITPDADFGSTCPVFFRHFSLSGKIRRATLTITSIGVYEAQLNEQLIGSFILAPGCTVYDKRLQCQQYDVTGLLRENNELAVCTGTGWYRGRINENHHVGEKLPCAIIAKLTLQYADDSVETIFTDTDWQVRSSRILSSDIYDGECYNASLDCNSAYPVRILQELTKHTLIPQEGEQICEQERIKPCRCFTTPCGEYVLDFGQNMAGYIEFTVNAVKGEKLVLSFAEVLDKDGNIYTENYRSARSKIEYICKDGIQTYKPHFTFMGFRYVKLEEYPAGILPENFTAIALYSQMKRTGHITCADQRINQLFSNTLWSQRSNFIDIPTDCPQRDERMGWLGDAQVFCKCAGYNYNVKNFFAKWCADLRAAQRPDGSVPDTVPNFWNLNRSSTAWGDAITIIPWTMYMLYGDKTILRDNFSAMKAWVDYITNDTLDRFLWTSPAEEKDTLWHKHYGDWLGLDASSGSYRGASDDDFIASVFYAYSTQLVVKTGLILGEDVRCYEELYGNIVKAFRERYNVFRTQTECVLALYFHLTDNPARTAGQLADMLKANGTKLQTGFVGTPYLLYALSENGYTDLAYELLFQNAYPSWLYEVEHGATTIWEHWDGIREDGSFWSKDMNSYNHYAYGSVIDWIYTVAGGINAVEEAAGFDSVYIAPKPDAKMGWLQVALETPKGTIRSSWYCSRSTVRYEISTPVNAEIVIGSQHHHVSAGSYVFYSTLTS